MSFLHDFFLGFNTTFAAAVCILVYTVMYYGKYIWSSAEPEAEELELEKLIHVEEHEVKQLAKGDEFICIAITDEDPRHLVDSPV